MIYDCFSFYNELDLLEIRLNVLNDVVDKFVLAEATHTHTGKPKPLYFNENKARYSAFADKIIHVIVDDFPSPSEGYTLRQASWMRENWQRNALVRGLAGASPKDLILISDLDEIPKPEAVLKASRRKGVVQFHQWFFNFYLNYLNYVRPFWPGTKALRYSDLMDPKTYHGMKEVEYVDKTVNPVPSLTKIRYRRGDSSIAKAGWHFSYLGGAEAVLEKSKCIAHVEYVTAATNTSSAVEKIINAGLDVTGCGYRFFPIQFDSRYPKYLLENKAKYRHLILSDKLYGKASALEKWRSYFCGLIRRGCSRLIPSFLKPFLFNVYCRIVKNPIKI